MAGPQRADPFAGGDLDLTGFTPAAPKKPAVQKAAIREVSEANNFPSRAPERKASPAKPPVMQRRRRTGRNVQFNIKASAEAIARFTALADKAGVSFGELFERACDALEKIDT